MDTTQDAKRIAAISGLTNIQLAVLYKAVCDLYAAAVDHDAEWNDIRGIMMNRLYDFGSAWAHTLSLGACGIDPEMYLQE